MSRETLIGPVRLRGNYGYLRGTGSFAVEPKFEELGECSEDLISFRSGNRIGFIDTSGKVVIEPRFEDNSILSAFRSGLAAVQAGGRVGYIDKSGDWRIGAQFDWGWHFLGAYALAIFQNQYCVIDQTGQTVSRLPVFDIPQLMDWVPDWNCFRCVFSGAGGFREGCMNWRGDTVFPPEHARLTDFHRGVAGFCDEEDDANDNRFGLVAFSGQIVKTPEFLDLDCFSEGLARGAQNLNAHGQLQEYGYIGTSGEWVIPPRFSAACRFSEGLARVGVGGITNRFGEEVEPPTFGFVDRNGEFLIEPTFCSARDFQNGFSVVETKGKCCVVAADGQLVWEGPL